MTVADTVEIRLEADTARYVRDLNNAAGQSTRSLGQINASVAASSAAYRGLGSSAASSAQQVIDANQRIATSASGANLQVGNIAAQFQDIGVTAAAGMNPLIIALQQGTQLSAVLNQSVQAGVSPVRALGSAFLQIINPISLGTIAIIALGTAAAQYLGNLISQGQVSNETLKEQEDAIRNVADRWGDAVPALRAYVDELDRAAAAGEEATARQGFGAATFREADEAVRPFLERLAGVQQTLTDLGAQGSDIQELRSAFVDLDRAIDNQTATTADADRVVQAMANFAGGPGQDAVARFGGAFGIVRDLVAQASAELAEFNQQASVATAPNAQIDAFNANREFVANQERLNGLTAEQLSLENEINRVRAQAERDDTPLSDAQALTIATDNLAAAERRRLETKALLDASKSDTRVQSEAEREAEAVLKLIEQLQFEYDLLGLTNEERAVANALRSAGAAATAEQRAEIEALVTATLTEREALAQLDETTQMWAQTAQDATRGFIDDLLEGKTAAEALGNVLKNLGSQLINLGLNSLFGGSGGGLLGGLFGGARANGGPVSSGSTYLVGERGPELFTPSSAGRITSNADLQGGGGFTFAPVVDARGADVAAVARLESSLRQLAGSMVPTIRKEIAVGPKKGRG